MRSKIFFRAAASLLALTVLAGCSSGAGSAGSDGSTTSSGGKVTLTFWSWVPHIDKVVALWNQQHPDIQVNVNTETQGNDMVTKLLTANKAGNLPDLAQAEFQVLPSLVTAGVASDISSLVGPVKGQFTDSTWNLVSFGGKQYGIPQDIGPMMMLYRQDLFQQYGLTVPKTWDEFAQDAEKLHAADPKRYLTTFGSNSGGWFAGLAGQAGSQWWSTQGQNWRVGIDDAASLKVADFWQKLVQDGSIEGQPTYTPEWNKQMNDGTLLTWPGAVWGPGVLAGIAPDTKGKWAMAPLPTWGGEQKTGFWGGSSTAITTKSAHRAEAAKFAIWLNTDPQAMEALVTQGNIYPASITGQSTPSLSKAPDFMPNQPDFFAQAKQIAPTAQSFSWGPDVNVTYSAFSDAFSKAIQSHSSFADALHSMQTTTVADMKRAGFSVAGG